MTFSVSGTIGITNTLIISSDITLNGTGQNVTISGNNNVGIFTVNPGVNLTLRNLTIANGSNSIAGGGIYNNGGIVTVVNCTFSNNIAVGTNNLGGNVYGGAICNDNGGALVVSGSTFVNNSITGGTGHTGVQGAQQYAAGGQGGSGGYALGGALCNLGGGSIAITNCTFYNNQAVGGHGGTGGEGYDGSEVQYVCGWYCCHYNSFGSCDQQCPEYCWRCDYGGPGGQGGNGGNGYGGSLYNNQGNITIVNTTFSNGSASGGGAGYPGSPGNCGSGNDGSGSVGGGVGGNLGQGVGQLVLINCIIANSASGGNYWGGAITDAGNNLSSDATLAFTNSGSFTNTNPDLGPLTNNGGPTWTMALLPGSPAIGVGQTIHGLTTDQRGLPRPSVYGFDIGAYEYEVASVDAGLRAYDGTAIIELACEGPGSTNSPLRFDKNGTNYGILLGVTNSPNASKFRIQSSSGVRSLLKLP